MLKLSAKPFSRGLPGWIDSKSSCRSSSQLLIAYARQMDPHAEGNGEASTTIGQGQTERRLSPFKN